MACQMDNRLDAAANPRIFLGVPCIEKANKTSPYVPAFDSKICICSSNLTTVVDSSKASIFFSFYIFLFLIATYHGIKTNPHVDTLTYLHRPFPLYNSCATMRIHCSNSSGQKNISRRLKHEDIFLPSNVCQRIN